MIEKIQIYDKQLKELNSQHDKKINELNSEINKLKYNVSELSKRMDKIELRDTIKMPFRYLYKFFCYRLTPQNKYKREIWEQLS